MDFATQVEELRNKKSIVDRQLGALESQKQSYEDQIKSLKLELQNLGMDLVDLPQKKVLLEQKISSVLKLYSTFMGGAPADVVCASLEEIVKEKL